MAGLKKELVKSIKVKLEELAPQMQLILPSHISVERMIQIILNACSANPTLMEPKMRYSLFLACIQAAKLKLKPNTPLGECYLIPYKGIVTMQPGYRGIKKLVMNTGLVSSMEPRVVYENDEFDYGLGLKPFLTHKPAKSGEKGGLMYAYCIVRFKDGSEPFFEVMDQTDISIIKKSSKSEAWKTNESEMWFPFCF